MAFSTLAGFVVGFLLTALGLCVTLHLAALYLLGEAPAVNAVAGVAPAVAIVALAGVNLPLAAAVAVGVDLVAIRAAYRLPGRRAALLALGHVTVSVILAFALSNLSRLLFASA